MKNSPILLLDEVTAALDAFNENKVMEILNGMKKDKTILLITHKLQMNEYSDLIIMLKKDGSIDIGSHEELSKSSKSYQVLWQNYLEKKNEVENIEKVNL